MSQSYITIGWQMMRKSQLSVLLFAMCGSLGLIVTSVQAVEPAGVAASSQVDVKSLLASATALIKAGKQQQAYDLLFPHQSSLAGDVDYDYLLGIAALDSGKPNAAIFALERVLAVNPNHLQARAEIARAYLAAGEVGASKQEFKTVQQQNPPKEVSATIQKYLDIIETHESEQKTSVRGYIEAGLGDDSNVNSATSNGQVAVPLFGGALVTLAAAGVQQHDTFANFAGGFNVRHALSPEWSVIGGANAMQHSNSTQSAFDFTSMDGSVGVSHSRGEEAYSVILQGQTFALNNQRYRDALGLTAQWLHSLDNGNQTSLYAQYTNLTYPGQAFRNADRYVLGGAYAMRLGGERSASAYVGGYVGNENERTANFAHIGNDLYGIRAGGEMKIAAQAKLIGSASLEERRYGGIDPLFLVVRKDTQSDIRVAVAYVPAPLWTVTPSVSYTSNSSNIVVNKYNRTAFTVSVRRDFN